MSNPVTIISDKVVRMLNSIVYLVICASHRNGSTSVDITRSLGGLAPVHADIYHQGMVERALEDLQREGRVARAGSRWYRV
ncbi:hypothetical protein [Pseudohalioglobus lutimaris]|uniref:Uncharacterized protein n=1 Tax=Pseudohalioglobus lutimaris TaxID=1737061 RepID=A0A2N5WWT6_9GAMM|nr:hypothetical protein [Pseudohalioglobus lutimaris]PLW66698.1 hypothetical protein C0039_20295 [Pseudohalioglobus lutimaris]